MLSAPGSILDIPVILDVVDVEISPLLGLDVLDDNDLFIEIVTNDLWSRINTKKDQLSFEDIWEIKLIRKGEHQHVPLSIPIQLFYTMAQ